MRLKEFRFVIHPQNVARGSGESWTGRYRGAQGSMRMEAVSTAVPGKVGRERSLPILARHPLPSLGSTFAISSVDRSQLSACFNQNRPDFAAFEPFDSPRASRPAAVRSRLPVLPLSRPHRARGAPADRRRARGGSRSVSRCAFGLGRRFGGFCGEPAAARPRHSRPLLAWHPGTRNFGEERLSIPV